MEYMVGGGYGCGQRMLTIQVSSEYMHGIAGGVLVVVVVMGDIGWGQAAQI